MGLEHLTIRKTVAQCAVATLLVTASGQSALPASTSVKPVEVQQYWKQALGRRFDRYFIRKRLDRAGLIPAISSPPTRLSDDPPHGPGIAPQPPGGRNESEDAPTSPEPVLDAKDPEATHLRITVKSFTANIGKRIGGFKDRSAAQRGSVYAWASDKLLSENPLTDQMSKNYRLFTQVDASVACTKGSLTAWQFSKLISDTGKEPPAGLFQAPPGLIRGVKFSRVNGSTISFEWFFYGKPHPVAEVAIQRIQPRTSVFVWHHIAGTISCVEGRPPAVEATLIGSRFPTHRWWLNNAIQTTLPQGVMSTLWTPGGPLSNIVK